MAKDYLALLRLNQERVLAGTGSPKILIGSINLGYVPNFHTFPLVEMGASIVAITVNEAHRWRPDMLYINHQWDSSHWLKMLPPRWQPDFFWDPQFEHGHYIPPGLSTAGIKTIVSFNHAHLGQALWQMRGMFDAIIAPSKQVAHFGTHQINWGLSWGSMRDRVHGLCPKDPSERDIDLSCTVGEGKLGKESIRPRVLEAVRKLKAERPDLKVEIASGLDPEAYYTILKRSKVSINVGTWGAPLTYRALEIVACGAAFLHIDEDGYGSTASIAEYDLQAVIVKPEEIAERIDGVLGSWAELAEAQSFAVESNYTYEHQYRRLEALSREVERAERPMGDREFSRRAYAINFTTGFQAEAAPHMNAPTKADLATVEAVPMSGEFPDICLWTPKDPERMARFRTTLARGENVADTYRTFYEEELHG
jgi:hypothetical protein